MHWRSGPCREHEQRLWSWNERSIGWAVSNPNAEEAILLIHGFGANTNHWRFNQPVLAEHCPHHRLLVSDAVINPELEG